ncbi:MAG: succinate dehydrogenase assembly factor 2 [Pseudomonadota bacterium]
MTIDPETRLKKLRIRAWRRGTKEMDLLLGRFIDGSGPELEPALLDGFETLMEENDNDLFQWISGQLPGPSRHAQIIERIQSFHAIN